ncbi:vitellogenin-5-like [Centruroides sculpturatus]|uniref:vitellogenin-5-like n=1 Tax=Centruroides sculpturatus TaxID=218467 RepID=UPI000C6DEDC4|nr:vitellogenin-5-like [Centruroides sculpturatus]
MRFLLCLALLCFAESSHHWKRDPWTNSIGKEYVYKYKGIVYSGLPAMSQLHSAFVLTCDLKVFPADAETVYLKMSNVMVGSIPQFDLTDVDIENIPCQLTPDPKFQPLADYPFAFKHVEGRITDSIFARQDKVWSKNVKRAIIEKFQVILSPQSLHRPDNMLPQEHIIPTEFKVLEDGIGGLCTSIYDVVSENNIFFPQYTEVLNVTKIRDYHDCLTRPVFEFENFDSKGCPWMCREHPMGPNPPMTPYRIREHDACPCGFEQVISPIKSYGVTKYNISLTGEAPIIEGLLNDGKVTLHVDGSDLDVLTRANITLVKCVPSGHVPSIPDPESFSTLGYKISGTFGQSNDFDALYASAFLDMLVPVNDLPDPVEELYKLTKNLAHRLVTNSHVPYDPHHNGGYIIGQLVAKVTKLMGYLKLEGFQKLGKRIIIKPTSVIEASLRKVFLDCLPLSGSTQSVKYMHQLIESKLLTNLEIKDVVEAVPQSVVFPTVETVEIMKDLCLKSQVTQQKKYVWGSTCVAFGKLVHKACVKPHPRTNVNTDGIPDHRMQVKYDIYKSFITGRDHRNIGDSMRPFVRNTCTPEHAQNYINELKHQLDSAVEFGEKSILIETIVHIDHISGIRVLEPYVKGTASNCFDSRETKTDHASCAFLRQVTIYALHHMVGHHSKHILPLVAPIYFNQAEPYELRVAAFTVILFADPPMHVLERIATESHSEQDNHVGSFVYSTFKYFGNGTHPCVRPISERLKIVFPKLKKFSFGTEYSKLFFKDVYSESLMSGIQAFLSYTSNNVSVFPRSFYHSLTHNWASYFNMPLEIGASMKGTEDLLKSINLFNDVFNAMNIPRPWDREMPDNMRRVRDDINITPRTLEIFKSTFFLKFFDRTTFIPLDKQSALEIIYDIKAIINDLSPNKPYVYVKVMLPNSIHKIIPSELGLPVTHMSINPLAYSIILRPFTPQMNPQMNPQEKEIKLQVITRLHYDPLILGMAVSTINKTGYGSAVFRSYHTRINAKICIKYKSYSSNTPKRLEVFVEPGMNAPLLAHQTTPGTFACEVRFDTQNPVILDDIKPIQVLPDPVHSGKIFTSPLIGMGVMFSTRANDYWAQLPLWKKGRTWKETFIECWKALENPSWKARDVKFVLVPDPTSPNQKLKLELTLDRQLVRYPSKDSRPRNILPDEYNSLWKPHETQHDIPDIQSRVASMIEKLQYEFEDRVSVPSSNLLSEKAFSIINFQAVLTGDNPDGPVVFHLLYAHSLDRTVAASSTVILHHKPKPYTWLPQKVCIETQMVTFGLTNDLHFHQESPFTTKCFLSVRVAPECVDSSPYFKIRGLFEKVHLPLLREDMQDYPIMSSSEPWYVIQCRTDMSMGKSLSFPCRLATLKEDLFNKLLLEMQYFPPSVTPFTRNLTEKAITLVTHYLFPNVDRNTVDVHHTPHHARLVALFQNPTVDMRVLDLFLYMPTQNLFLKKLSIPYLYPLSTWSPTRNLYLNELIDYDLTTECLLMENYLTTLDNVTIPYPHDSCKRILSKDCSSQSIYTVYAKGVGGIKKELTVIAESTTIVLPPLLNPTACDYEFTVDSTSHVIHCGDVYVINKGEILSDYIYLVQTVDNLNFVVLMLERLGISIKFDGVNAKIRVSPWYRGKECGICGDYNGNGYLDFMGPQECIWELSEDFISKYTEDSCSSRTVGPYYCPNQNPYPIYPRDRPWNMPLVDHPLNKPLPQAWSHQPAESPWAPESQSEPLWAPESQSEPLWAPESQSNPLWSSDLVTQWSSTGPMACKRYITRYIQRGDKVCFAMQPTLECKPSCREEAISSVHVPFHCLPASSSYTRELMRQADERMLHLKWKSVDLQEMITVPTDCRPVLKEV